MARWTPIVAVAATLALAGPAAAAQDRDEPEGPRNYDDVLPDDVVTRRGLFTTHFAADGTLYLEIPRRELGREMLVMVGTVERPEEAGDDGSGDIVQWDRRRHTIVLRLKNYTQIADTSDAIARAVHGMRRGPIVATFDIEAYGPDSSALIDATELFTTTHEEIGSLPSVDDDASWIDEVVAFPRNIEIDVTQTGEIDDEATTHTQHWSFLKLPDDPMMPRLRDRRVGYISSEWIDYSSDYHGTEEVEFIHRHRLEKRNPGAPMSDPVEPIVYWVDPATPDWLKPYVVQGVNDWQPAFEAAGFTNAIMGRLAPTPEEDPTFSMDDARYSVIYWRPSTTANANGGQVEDPRTGEIIRGRVQMYHNALPIL